jgi:hypothetical protein
MDVRGFYSMHGVIPSKDTLNIDKFTVAKKQFIGESRDIAMVAALITLFYNKRTPGLVRFAYEQLSEFRNFFQDPRYLKYFENICNRNKTMLPGNAVPDYYLPDTSNNLISFSQFRGKTVYVEFWGTWCAPCLHELSYLKKLEKTFASDTNVVFWGIEWGGQRDIWKDIVKDSSLGGVQVHLEGSAGTKLTNDYVLDFVPQYWLIDKEGKIITTSAEHPFEKGIIDEIKQAELQ